MDFTIPSLVSMLILVWLFIEAKSGPQKVFARTVVVILFTNMTLVNTGVYTRAIGDPIVLVALGILVVMLSVRLLYWFHNKRST